MVGSMPLWLSLAQNMEADDVVSAITRFLSKSASGQRLTQWLVDQFSGDERRWRELQEKLDDHTKRFKRHRKHGKPKKRQE